MTAAGVDFDFSIYDTEECHASLHSIFFDMENAFPRVWSYRILTILHQLGLRDAFPILLKNYLLDPTFRVRASNHYSSIPSHENGIPQGFPLCGTLFLIAINDVTKVIHHPIHRILFFEDLSMHLRFSKPQRAFRILRSTTNQIHEWLTPHGFRIATSKTKLIIFQKTRTSHPIPESSSSKYYYPSRR